MGLSHRAARRIAPVLTAALALTLGVAAPAAAHGTDEKIDVALGQGPVASPLEDLADGETAADPAQPDLDAPDPDFEPKMVPGIGYAQSRTVGGTYEMRIGKQTVQFDNHAGADEALANSSSFKLSAAQSAPPACSSSGRRFVVVYAYPEDRPNRVASVTSALRTSIWRANGKLAAESAIASGAARTALMRVDCDGVGQVEISAVPVPKTCSGQGDPGLGSDGICRPHYGGHVSYAVQNALGAPQGSDSVKYVIFYDEPGTGYSGVGFGYFSGDGDVKSQKTNPNRNYTTSAAVLYPEYWDSVTVLHEMGHLMGAVQNTAPHSSGRAHCVDGNDVMCYRDSNSSSFSDTNPSYWPNGAYNALGFKYDSAEGMPFDCNYDDYFRPIPGNSYLDSHWNTGGYENDLLVYTPEWPAPPPSPDDQPNTPRATHPDLSVKQVVIGRPSKRGFSVQVRNDGDGASSGETAVISSITGAASIKVTRGVGWQCQSMADTTVGCTQADPLEADVGYPPLKIYVEPRGSGTAQVTNSAVLFNASDVNPDNNASDTSTSVQAPRGKRAKRGKSRRGHK